MTSNAVKTFAAVFLGDLIFAGSSVLIFFPAKIDPHAPATLKFMVVSIVAGIMFAFAGTWLHWRSRWKS
jgi:hypothetical protein